MLDIFFAEFVNQHLQFFVAKVESVDLHMQSFYLLLEIHLASQRASFNLGQTDLSFLLLILFIG